VGRFLEYSRPAPPRRADVDLARVAQETLEVFAHDPASARTTVRAELAEARASCDPDQIRQVLWNLLVNACQASATARVTVRCRSEPGGAILEVEDDGPGIAPEDLPQIFTPFFTTKASGTGLGLATVQRLVDAHGGSVSVRSGPGQGACFTVHLPVGSGISR
jgi:two-component system sensor histidine kinase PilS (NtrC family)